MKELSPKAEDALRVHAYLNGGSQGASDAIIRATTGLRDLIASGMSLADLAIALGGIARIQADLAKHDPEESMVTFQSFVEVGFKMFEGAKDKLEAAQKKDDSKRNLDPKLN